MARSFFRPCIHAPALPFTALQLCLVALNAQTTSDSAYNSTIAPTTSIPTSLCHGKCVPGVTYCSPFLTSNHVWTAQCIANCSATQCPIPGIVCLSTQCELLYDRHVCADNQTQSLPVCYNHTDEQTFDSCGPNRTWCSPKRPYCYDNAYRCNGIDNCPEGEDESNCHTEAPTTVVTMQGPTNTPDPCDNLCLKFLQVCHILPKSKFPVCEANCTDNGPCSDEENCTAVLQNPGCPLGEGCETIPKCVPLPTTTTPSNVSLSTANSTVFPTTNTTTQTTTTATHSTSTTVSSSPATKSHSSATSTPTSAANTLLPTMHTSSSLSPTSTYATTAPSVTTKIPTSLHHGPSTMNRKPTNSPSTSHTDTPTQLTSNSSWYSPAYVKHGKKKGLTLGEVIGIAVVGSILVLLMVVLCRRRQRSRGRYDVQADRYRRYNDDDDDQSVPMQTIGRPRLCLGGEEDDVDLEEVENLDTDTNLTNFPVERDELHL